jgi:hypothetical protein
VKFGFHIFASTVLFPANIFYSMCCNLIISKEKHKIVKYLGVGDSDIFQHGIRTCTLRGRQFQIHNSLCIRFVRSVRRSMQIYKPTMEFLWVLEGIST